MLLDTFCQDSQKVSIRSCLTISFAFPISQIDLTPLVPLSKQQGKMIFMSQYVWRGGEI